MKETPSGERVHIAFFGRRNAGKSSLLNAVTGQRMSLVSPEKGTTTDPVRKSMELLPIGPVVMIDTPGFDDTGALGEMRVRRTKEVLDETDLAVLVTDARDAAGAWNDLTDACTSAKEAGTWRNPASADARDAAGAWESPASPDGSAEATGAWKSPADVNARDADGTEKNSVNSAGGKDSYRLKNKAEKELAAIFRERRIPFIIVRNKADLLEIREKTEEEGRSAGSVSENRSGTELPQAAGEILVSARTGYHIRELKEMIGRMIPEEKAKPPLIRDLVRPGDFVLLVIPIDGSAPKGRLILPQQQVIRELLEYGAFPVLTEPDGIPETLSGLRKPPALAVTDSQKFREASKRIPEEVPLTSFSILFARYKGILTQAVRGTEALKELKEGDRVLISEGCTHHRQCEDIGTVKLPKLLERYTGHPVRFETTSGREFPREPEQLKSYRLILHCGGCMLNEREVLSRMRIAKEAGVPMTNYGTAIACMTGILERSLEVFSGETRFQ